MAKVLGKIEKLTEQVSALSELCKTLKNSKSDLLNQIEVLNAGKQELQEKLNDQTTLSRYRP